MSVSVIAVSPKSGFGLRIYDPEALAIRLEHLAELMTSVQPTCALLAGRSGLSDPYPSDPFDSRIAAEVSLKWAPGFSRRFPHSLICRAHCCVSSLIRT